VHELEVILGRADVFVGFTLGQKFKSLEEFGDGLAMSLVLGDEFSHGSNERLDTAAALFPDLVCNAPVVEVGVDVFEAPFTLAGAVFGCFDVASENARGVPDELIELLGLGLGALPWLNGFVDLLGARLLVARHEIWLLRDWPCRDPRGLAVKSVCASITATTRRTAFEKLGATNAARFSTFVAAATTARSIATSHADALVDVHGGVKSSAATSRATQGGATTRHGRRRIGRNRK
jgi:hypothetical protein